ncbi:MAG: FkbM family methyltransferase [Planctomycetota bacterium]
MTAPTDVPHPPPPFDRFRTSPLPSADTPGISTDHLGIRTRQTFFQPNPDADPGTPRWPPAIDEEWPEWLDLIDAICDANPERGFTMVELGAGFGRWITRAGVLCRYLKNEPIERITLVGVEAEPDHFAMMRQHLDDNGLLQDPDVTTHLHPTAVDAEPGEVPFHIGHPDQWYGQAIARGDAAGRMQDFPEATIQSVPALSLTQILEPLPHADLLDLDIQGSEHTVLAAATDALNAKVRRVHIGTHSTALEADLRTLFNTMDWRPHHDFPCGQTVETLWGTIPFGDGVQTWINPNTKA